MGTLGGATCRIDILGDVALSVGCRILFVGGSFGVTLAKISNNISGLSSACFQVLQLASLEMGWLKHRRALLLQ